MTVHLCNDQTEWDEIVRQLDGHPLQLWGWGELKAGHNWRAYRLIVEEQGRVVGGAQVLQRKLPWPFRSLLYVPRGPVGDLSVVLPQLTEDLSTRLSATHIAIEPHRIDPVRQNGWSAEKKAVLLPRTIILDLSQSEEQLLADMNKKTRQYIRKSANSGVSVRRAEAGDISTCLSIYRETAKRAKFSLHSDSYYQKLHNEMGDASRIFVAEYEGRIVAFLWLVMSPAVAFELYGGVDDVGQRLRANYSLKWQAIRDMQASGVQQYDINGLLNDGVSNFKKGFSSQETMLAGTYEHALSIWYWPWKLVFPILKLVTQAVASLRK